jgi:hypothetical protein
MLLLCDVSHEIFDCCSSFCFASAAQGINHDLRVWRDTIRLGRLPLEPKEWIMGDPAYWTGAHCAVKRDDLQLSKGE